MTQIAAYRGYVLTVLAATMWATLGLFGKYLYRYPVDPLIVVNLRAIIAALILGVSLAVFSPEWLRINIRHIPFFTAYGVIGVALNYTSFFYALKWNTVTSTVILLYTYPAMVVVGAAILFHEPLTQPKLFALLSAVVGCFLVAQGYDRSALQLNLPGVIFSLGAATTMACYGLMGKHGTKDYPGWTVVFYAIGFGAITLTIWNGPILFSALSYPWQAWMLILGLALVPTVLAYSFFTLALKYIEVGRASIVATLEPVLAAVVAYALLGERMTWPQWAGAGLILIGIWVLQHDTGRLERRLSQA